MSDGVEREELMAAGNADLDLHFRIAELSRNRFLQYAMNTIMIRTRMTSFSDPHGYGIQPDLVHTHGQIVDAIADGDAEAAQAHLSRMLRGMAARVRDAAPDQLLRDPDLERPIEPEWPTLDARM